MDRCKKLATTALTHASDLQKGLKGPGKAMSVQDFQAKMPKGINPIIWMIEGLNLDNESMLAILESCPDLVTTEDLNGAIKCLRENKLCNIHKEGGARLQNLYLGCAHQNNVKPDFLMQGVRQYIRTDLPINNQRVLTLLNDKDFAGKLMQDNDFSKKYHDFVIHPAIETNNEQLKLMVRHGRTEQYADEGTETTNAQKLYSRMLESMNSTEKTALQTKMENITQTSSHEHKRLNDEDCCKLLTCFICCLLGNDYIMS